MDPTSVIETDAFEIDAGLVAEEVRRSVCTGYRKKKNRHCEVWHDYCLSENIDPDLRYITRDPILCLQVFAARYRDGRIAPGGRPVKSRTVEDALRSVGQSFSMVGAQDPTKDRWGKTEYRLRSQLRAYAKNDKPPDRVKPAPVMLVLKALEEAYRPPNNACEQAIANLVCIAFFFCLRPGEYTGTTTDDQAFCLNDVTFFQGKQRLNPEKESEARLLQATAVHLHFTTQKNEDKGTVIAHARSNHPLCCPVTALARQILMHRRHFDTKGIAYDGSVKVASYYRGGLRRLVTAKQVTTALRHYARILEPITGISPSELSARSLRAGGAMALLSSGCEAEVIKLLARWKSDAMMVYLHQQSLPIFKRLAVRMYNNGEHTFLPEDTVPSVAPLVPGDDDDFGDYRIQDDDSIQDPVQQSPSPGRRERLATLTPRTVMMTPIRRSQRIAGHTAPRLTPPERCLQPYNYSPV